MENKLLENQINSNNYHLDRTRISKSGLDLVNISPLHYWESYLNPNADPAPRKDFFELGEAFHCAVMEPHKFTQRYHITPIRVDRRSRDGKTAWAAHQTAADGKIILGPDEYKVISKMRDRVLSNPICKKLLSTGISEKVILFDDPTTGVKCKCKPDWMTPDQYVVDLKSTKDASPAGFTKAVKNYRYYVQRAFYSDGIETALGWYPREFIFIAVEKKPPYAMGIYTISNTATGIGRAEYSENLITYKKCLEKGVWPGFSPRVEMLEIF